MVQSVTLTGNQTFVGNPPDDDYIITDNGVGNNTITIGNGTDQLTLGAGGNNTMTLGDGTDQITAGGASNTITTGNGNSHITVGNGSNTITVGTGSNTIALGIGGTGDTVSTEAGNNLVSASGAAISGDTIKGALGSFDGTTNRLVLTTPGTMSPVNVSGFQSYQLANGGLNSLTLSETNFARLPGGSISVIGGDSGNTVDAGSLSAAHGVVVSGGAGTDKFTGGSGNDRFVFTPSSLGPNDTADGGAGNNTLELAAGGSGVLSGLGTSFVNIGTVLLDTDAVWTIEISNPAEFTGMISGLSARDSLDLPFMSFSSSGTAMLGLGNVLQISENGSTVAINLDPNQSFMGDIFRLAPDSGGGTLVSEVLAGASDAPVVFGSGLPGASGAPVVFGSGLPGASDVPVVFGSGLPEASDAPVVSGSGLPGASDAPVVSASGLPGASDAPVVIGPPNFNVTPVPGGDLMLTAQPIPETFDFGSWVFNAEIAGFDPTQDAILLSSSLAGSFTNVQANMSPLGGATLITFDASHSLTLDGIQQGSLSAANFRFT